MGERRSGGGRTATPGGDAPNRDDPGWGTGSHVERMPRMPYDPIDPDAEWWDRDRMVEGSLVHPIRDGEMLLIEKKRGVGEGNVVGPGGKLEGAETPKEAGIREVREETAVEVHDAEKVGEMEFVFGEDPFMLVNVFVTTEFAGTPTESDEAIPVWHPVDDLPYDRMWADDRYWVPYMLDREPFLARFRFDADGDEVLTGYLDDGVEF